VLAVWIFFSGGEYLGMLLAVVSVFILIAVAIPYLIWRSRWKFQGAGAGEKQGESLREWLSGDFETWQCRLSARDAAIEILLPLAAISFGITAFGIALHFAVTQHP
jgi:hypothetical protein